MFHSDAKNRYMEYNLDPRERRRANDTPKVVRLLRTSDAIYIETYTSTDQPRDTSQTLQIGLRDNSPLLPELHR